MRLPDIYITANKQAGKTTIANFLAKEYGYKKVSFAQPLKEIAAYIIKQLTGTTQEINEIVESINNGTYSKDAPVTIESFTFWNGIRPILQGVGEGCRKYINQDIWYEAAFYNETDIGIDAPIVIDDCRYPNEAELLRMEGFEGIFINKPGSDGGHESEKCQHNHIHKLIPADLVIDYTKGEKAAIEEVRAFIESYKSKVVDPTNLEV